MTYNPAEMRTIIGRCCCALLLLMAQWCPAQRSTLDSLRTVMAGATATMREPATRVNAPRISTRRGPDRCAITAARKMTSSDATLGVSLTVAAAESPAEKVASIGVTR